MSKLEVSCITDLKDGAPALKDGVLGCNMDIKPEGFANRTATEFRKEVIMDTVVKYDRAEVYPEGSFSLTESATGISGTLEYTPVSAVLNILPEISPMPNPGVLPSLLCSERLALMEAGRFYQTLEKYTPSESSHSHGYCVTFDQALLALKEGKTVARVHWIPRGSWLGLGRISGTPMSIQPSILLYYPDHCPGSPGATVIWGAMSEDLLANDWVVSQESSGIV